MTAIGPPGTVSSPMQTPPMNEPRPTTGQRIRAELERRGWTQDDLARILGRSRPDVTNVILGKLGVSAELASRLAAALGGTTKDWLDLEVDRQLSLVPASDEAVARMARLYQAAPVKSMERRGWIKATKSVDDLEAELTRFFDGTPLDTDPTFPATLRKTDRLTPLTIEQRAWILRARELAKVPVASPFDPSRMGSAARAIRAIAAFPDEAYKLPTVLGDYGIRFVVIEPLPGGSIDGASFWLDEHSPVIAISLRLDRVDWFWHTVAHEFSHIRNHDDYSVDENLVGEDRTSVDVKDAIEKRADAEAAALLVPPEKLQSFISRVGPLYSKVRLNQFANTVKMHPGIIVGQLQHLGEISYGHHREMLVRIRDTAIAASICDGWNRTIGTL
ncbi:MAG: helix-turn-helix domain-containing protein [Planctomycetes bacterium]|nr:helix-turn-helix domain-containing protein [Planctomycetota bacterium]